MFTSLIRITCLIAMSLWHMANPLVVPITDSRNSGTNEGAPDTLSNHIVLEPFTYSEDFNDRELGAWVSYPSWQDLAYNQNFEARELIPGDPNISIVQKVTPYTNVDNYAGAQKLLDMYLMPGATVRFRYYLKTHQQAEWYKVRFAAGEYGKLDVAIPNPQTNQWVWVTVSYDDFVTENPVIAGKEKVKIYALAFLVKFPDTDPDMPVFFGLDDVTFSGARSAAFRFAVPNMYKLPEFKPYIPTRPYHVGSIFELKGEWPVEADKVIIEIFPYTDRYKSVYHGKLSRKNNSWTLKPFRLDFSGGLYLATLKAFKGPNQLSDTEFTIHVVSNSIGGKHPRLLSDAKQQLQIANRFKEERFREVFSAISKTAEKLRLRSPVESLVYDLDQFPEEDWLPTWSAFGTHIYHTGEALRQNARAYVFHGDPEAGEYVKGVLLRLAEWPSWNHPWQGKRGRFSDHRTGAWAHCLAEAYDLVYNLMSNDERSKVRAALLKNIVYGTHRTYVYNDNIAAATSNWLATTIGGSLMVMASMYADGVDTETMEPYFTGAILKLDKFIRTVTDVDDGTWGEGFGYHAYSFRNLCYSLPSLENVFHIDLSKPLIHTYNEYLWAGWIKKKRWFEFGDSKDELTSMAGWPYLLEKYRDPGLSWLYDFLKEKQTYEDVIFSAENIPKESPFTKNPVKLFRKIGTTVFKSGWEPDDFVFVMRTGPFYNHQHMDQGSFWFADRGKILVGERPKKNSDYYDDPIYEAWLTHPVGHSTILVDGNHQSQRVGDHLNFAPGFDDYAYVSHFLDGEDASFVTGDIGRLYWGKVSRLSRNVLYLKPRTILMLDVATPSEQDAEITLLYQSARFDGIKAGRERSSITVEGTSLHLSHVWPRQIDVKAVKTPHYLNTLRDVRPLEWEGMLTVSSKTRGEPLVIANVLTATEANDIPDVITHMGDRFVWGEASGQKFAFSTDLENVYVVEGMQTDALAITWDASRVFAANARTYLDGSVSLRSDIPITVEYVPNDGSLKYYIDAVGQLTLNLTKRVSSIMLNGEKMDLPSGNGSGTSLTFQVQKGEGMILFR